MPDADRLGEAAIRRGDLVDQPPVVGLRGRDQLAGQEQLPRTAVADLPGQVVHDDRGDQSAEHLGIADPGGLGGDREVAGGHQPRASGQGVAVEGGDRRLGQRVQLLDQVGILLERGHRVAARPRHRLAPSAASFRSMPEQKTVPAPVSTTRADLGLVTDSVELIARARVIRARESALRCSGRLSVRIATGPSSDSLHQGLHSSRCLRSLAGGQLSEAGRRSSRSAMPSALPCVSSRSERLAPPARAFSITKLNARSRAARTAGPCRSPAAAGKSATAASVRCGRKPSKAASSLATTPMFALFPLSPLRACARSPSLTDRCSLCHCDSVPLVDQGFAHGCDRARGSIPRRCGPRPVGFDQRRWARGPASSRTPAAATGRPAA